MTAARRTRAPHAALAALALLQLPASSTDDPRTVLRAAQWAVEGDSVQRVAARWQRRLRDRPADRAAQLGLATLARLAYRTADAEEGYAALLRGSAGAGDPFATYALIGQAQLLETRRQMAAADSLYGRAAADARRARDSAAEAQVLLGLFALRVSTVGLTQALPLLDSAARTAPASAPDLLAQFHCARAAALVPAGRLDAALAEVDSGVAAARGVRLRGLEGRCLGNAGRAARARGQLDSARVILRRAAGLLERAHDDHGLARTLLYDAQVSMLQGRYGEAKETMRRAMQTGERSGDSASVGSAQLGLADVALSVNDYPTAAGLLTQAVARFEASGDRDRATVARVWQAQLAAALGDYAQARQRTREVLAWYEQAGNAEGQGVQHRALAQYATRERDWPAAEAALAAARDLARRHDLRLLAQKLTFDEARLAAARGDLGNAERSFDAYLQGLPPDQHVQRYETHTRLAEVYARRGELARAEQTLRAAESNLDAWRATLGEAPLRVLAFQATSSEANDVGSALTTALAALAAGGRAAAAFELAEHRRARELSDHLVQGEALRTKAADSVPRRDRLGSDATRATAAYVTAAIPDDSTALLEYVADDRGAVAVFVLSRKGGLRAHSLATVPSLSAQVARFVAQLESGANPPALARALGAALLDPALAGLPAGVSRLVVVPDGPLHRLPFDALRLPDGGHAVERYAISVAPSAAVVAELWRRGRGASQPAGAPVRLLAMGDPSFQNETRRAAGQGGDPTRSAFALASALPRLRASGEEAREVARYAPGAVVRLRSWATESFLKREALRGYRVIHLATHALVDEQSVARTAIALAPGGGEDGFLTPGELAVLDLRADLVVLSACRTAGGVVLAGEGIQGLTAPLLQAGARAVVATAWRIGDRAAVGMVNDFYDALARGQPAAEALRSAKLAAIRRGAPASEWAAFSVVGDPTVKVPLRRPAERPLWLFVTAALAGMGVVGWLMVRRRAR